MSKLRWHKGHPCDGGSCVEVAAAEKEVMIRSSLSPAALLTVTRAEWQDFLADAKQGLFDQV